LAASRSFAGWSANPAYGFAKLEEEIEEMLIADAKHARGK
jgi:hypothetical protein